MIGGGLGHRVGDKVCRHAASAGQDGDEGAHHAEGRHVHKLLLEPLPGKAEAADLVVGLDPDTLVKGLGGVDELAYGVDADKG